MATEIFTPFCINNCGKWKSVKRFHYFVVDISIIFVFTWAQDENSVTAVYLTFTVKIEVFCQHSALVVAS